MKNTCEQFRRFNRRDFLRIGGARAVRRRPARRAARAGARHRVGRPKAKHMICVWMGGGPPHIDMFDMKPDAPGRVPRRVQADPTERARPRRSAS